MTTTVRVVSDDNQTRPELDEARMLGNTVRPGAVHKAIKVVRFSPPGGTETDHEVLPQRAATSAADPFAVQTEDLSSTVSKAVPKFDIFTAIGTTSPHTAVLGCSTDTTTGDIVNDTIGSGSSNVKSVEDSCDSVETSRRKSNFKVPREQFIDSLLHKTGKENVTSSSTPSDIGNESWFATSPNTCTPSISSAEEPLPTVSPIRTSWH
mmetsp:Transcript_29335/g.33912  ORF Transcript_29335/g.33912 Transcript_29335/m.33912 type:complete len:208 (+) Transcript_29335:68-691(+)